MNSNTRRIANTADLSALAIDSIASADALYQGSGGDIGSDAAVFVAVSMSGRRILRFYFADERRADRISSDLGYSITVLLARRNSSFPLASITTTVRIAMSWS